MSSTKIPNQIGNFFQVDFFNKMCRTFSLKLQAIHYTQTENVIPTNGFKTIK